MSTIIHAAVDDLMKRVAALENQQDYRTALTMLLTALLRRCSACNALPMLCISDNADQCLWMRCPNNCTVVNGGTDLDRAIKHIGRQWLEL
jgi:gamma-glutamyl phosphate reductase